MLFFYNRGGGYIFMNIELISNYTNLTYEERSEILNRANEVFNAYYEKELEKWVKENIDTE